MNSLSTKTILLALFGIYIFAITFASLNTPDQSYKVERGLSNFCYESHEQTPHERIYKFSNPALAYKILTQLDTLPPLGATNRYNTNDPISIPRLNLKTDDRYCDKHRQYIVSFPEAIFQDLNVIMDRAPGTLMRNKVVPQVGNDIQSYIGLHMPKNETRIYDIKPQVNLFLTRKDMYKEKRIGQHFSCLTQISSHIPSQHALSQKDRVAEEVQDYAKQYADRPDCFNFDKFFPKTYLLYRQEDCIDFFKAFNSQQYQTLKEERRIVYIRKDTKNKHMGLGVEPINDKQESELRTLYADGELCGKVQERFLVQNYIHNPLLLNGRKFDFRIYLLLASSNPFMAYYHDGFLRVSLMKYNVNSDDKKVLLTNLALSYQIYDDAKEGQLYQGMDEEALKHAQQWSFERLQAYLLEAGVIRDPNWLDNYLRPEFKKALVHLLRFSMKPMYEHSSVFQLYGVDFMLDENLNLWFIEANAKPGLGEYSQPMEKFIVKMLVDHLEIVSGLLRSRTKRIVRYVNMLIDSGMVKETREDEVVIRELEQTRVTFKKISKNWFEKEFEPSDGNGFSKILDENYSGEERYQGLIEAKCL